MTQPMIISPVFIEEGFYPILSSDGSITAERRVFEVRRSSRQHRLLKALASCRSGVLRREDLVEAVYADRMAESTKSSAMNILTGHFSSSSFSKSLTVSTKSYNTAVKTLSRIRISLEKFFGDLTPPGFDWLPWNEKLGGWILFSQLPVNQARA